MNRVEPIKSLKQIERMRAYLLEQSERNEMILLFGIYTGLRISDMLKLQVKDVRNKKHIRVHEAKTGKNKIFKIPENFKDKLNEYVSNLDDDSYLFPGRTGDQPLTRSAVHRILKGAAKHVGVSGVACHSLRKTYGYFIYQQTKDVATLMRLFNHSNPSTTLLYIGITQIEKDKAVDTLDFSIK